MDHGNDKRIDDAVLRVTGKNWCKVAMVMARVEREYGEALDDVVAERIKTLVASGALESQGDLSRWRYSEVRWPAETLRSIEAGIADAKAGRVQDLDEACDRLIAKYEERAKT